MAAAATTGVCCGLGTVLSSLYVFHLIKYL